MPTFTPDSEHAPVSIAARPWHNGDMARNVLGEPLSSCSMQPLTGFFRDGSCRSCDEDVGRHCVCVEVNAAFLAFSRERGNDLSTPRPEFGFAGLKPGDRWCLCSVRWQEALEAGAAPPIVIQATEEKALEDIELADLKRFAVDLC